MKKPLVTVVTHNVEIPSELFQHNNLLLCPECYEMLHITHPPKITIEATYEVGRLGTMAGNEVLEFSTVAPLDIYDAKGPTATPDGCSYKMNSILDSNFINEYTDMCVPMVTTKCPCCDDTDMIQVDAGIAVHLINIWELGYTTSFSCIGEVPYIVIDHSFDILKFIDVLSYNSNHVVRDLGVAPESEYRDDVSDAYVVILNVTDKGYKFSFSIYKDHMGMYVEKLDDETEYTNLDNKFAYLISLLGNPNL